MADVGDESIPPNVDDIPDIDDVPEEPLDADTDDTAPKVEPNTKLEGGQTDPIIS